MLHSSDIGTSVSEVESQLRERTEELEYRKKLEAILVSLSTQFINLPYEKFQQGLEEVVEQIGKLADVDRCFIYQFEGIGAPASLTHEWCAAGVPRRKSQLQNVPTEQFAWELQQMSQGETLSFDDVSQMPKQAAGFAALYRRIGLLSVLNMPLLVEGKIRGVLGLSTVTRKKNWCEDDHALLRVLGEVLATVLARENAKHALAESEQRFRQIVRDQTEMIVQWLPSGEITFVNDAVCRFTDSHPQDWLGQDFFASTHAEDLSGFKQEIAKLTPQHPIVEYERRVFPSAGQFQWLQWVDRALFDEHRQLTGYQSVGRDISRLRKSQQEIERRLAFEKLLLDLSTRVMNATVAEREKVLSGVLRDLGRFTEVDRCFLYLVNQEETHSELAVYWSSAFAPPVDERIRHVALDSIPNLKQELLAGRPHFVRSVQQEEPAKEHVDKALHAMHTKSFINVPMLSGQRLVGYFGFATHVHERHWTEEDIALLRLVGENLVNSIERQQAQQELGASQEKLRIAIEGVEEGVFDVDMLTGTAEVSEFGLQLLGMSGECARNVSEYLELVYDDDREAVIDRLLGHLAGHSPVFETDLRLKDSDGQYRWIQVRGRVIERDAENQPVRMVGVARDISVSMRMREEQQRLQTRLVQLSRASAMGETVAGIAHEVNQPLHASATYNAAARSALRAGKAQKAEELSRKASEQIERAGDIIHRMRDYTRARPSKLVLTDLNELLRRSAESALEIGKADPPALKLDLAEALPMASCDPVQIQQVIVNLIQNACDSIAEAQTTEGRVLIRTLHEPGQAIIQVSDNGAGCSPDELGKIFEAFVSTKAKGMGIGLSLSRTIVEMHGGVISADTNADCGMTFTVTLPLAGGIQDD